MSYFNLTGMKNQIQPYQCIADLLRPATKEEKQQYKKDNPNVFFYNIAPFSNHKVR